MSFFVIYNLQFRNFKSTILLCYFTNMKVKREGRPEKNDKPFSVIRKKNVFFFSRFQEELLRKSTEICIFIENIFHHLYS